MRLRRVLADVLVPMDIIVVSEHRVQEWRDVRGSLIHSRGTDRRSGARRLMASEQDLAEQLLRRADEDAALAEQVALLIAYDSSSEHLSCIATYRLGHSELVRLSEIMLRPGDPVVWRAEVAV